MSPGLEVEIWELAEYRGLNFFIFQNSFRFIAKLSRKYRESLSLALTPTVFPLSTSAPGVLYLLKLKNLFFHYMDLLSFFSSNFIYLFRLKWGLVAELAFSVAVLRLLLGGFSCGAEALRAQALVIAAHGLSSCGFRLLEHSLSSCGAWTSCSSTCGIFPDQSSNSVSPPSADGFLTTRLSGMPLNCVFWWTFINVYTCNYPD